MSSRELKNKPLVEAILEIRWALQEKAPGFAVDPHYRLLLGRLFDRLHADYPVHEQLDTANIPDEMAGHTVQHRFRVADGEWPLVQLGPGVFTVNDTSRYIWPDFRDRAIKATQHLFDCYPKAASLNVNTLLLRYIDAIELPSTNGDFLTYLQNMLKVSVNLPPTFFENTNVESSPVHFQLHQAFQCAAPAGQLQLRIAIGQKGDRPALIWETIMQSSHAEVPKMLDNFESWLDASHKLVNDWFFKMIEGELHRRFRGE
ncbi:MAG: TIGR04255 family protein [Planctomycetaceae bacterium]|nr:TIGR04255 family protein [Planctomycetaceae bacterium]